MSELTSLKRLQVYQVAIEFLGVAAKILDNIPRGHALVIDQLKRASISISSNIAEGAGRFSRAEKRNFYNIARGSALECYAALDACEIFELSRPENINEGRELLVRIVAMLTRLVA